jgi:hypothetical protein
MYDLENAITDRRSIRMFQSDRPLPRDLVDEARSWLSARRSPPPTGYTSRGIRSDNVVFHDY